MALPRYEDRCFPHQKLRKICDDCKYISLAVFIFDRDKKDVHLRLYASIIQVHYSLLFVIKVSDLERNIKKNVQCIQIESRTYITNIDKLHIGLRSWTDFLIW